MSFMTKWAPALVLRLARATPASTLAPENQADFMQPGSVIIFPKFINKSRVPPTASLCRASRSRSASCVSDGLGPYSVSRRQPCLPRRPHNWRFDRSAASSSAALAVGLSDRVGGQDHSARVQMVASMCSPDRDHLARAREYHWLSQEMRRLARQCRFPEIREGLTERERYYKQIGNFLKSQKCDSISRRCRRTQQRTSRSLRRPRATGARRSPRTN
jgi:hypothetical protein